MEYWDWEKDYKLVEQYTAYMSMRYILGCIKSRRMGYYPMRDKELFLEIKHTVRWLEDRGFWWYAMIIKRYVRGGWSHGR